MLDLPYEEDVRADTDMNVVMTGSGRFVEVQGTAEHEAFDRDELDALLDLAAVGIHASTKPSARCSRRLRRRAVVATFVLATANPHKAEEMRDVLAPLGVELLARPLDVADVEETGATLEGNALLKARALVAATGLAAIADDTGLFIDALEGRPGVYSARYAGENATYADNVDKALAELRRTCPMPSAAPEFRSVIAVAYPDGTSWWVDGVLDGRDRACAARRARLWLRPDLRARRTGGRTLAELVARTRRTPSRIAVARCAPSPRSSPDHRRFS